MNVSINMAVLMFVYTYKMCGAGEAIILFEDLHLSGFSFYADRIKYIKQHTPSSAKVLCKSDMVSLRLAWSHGEVWGQWSFVRTSSC